MKHRQRSGTYALIPYSLAVMGLVLLLFAALALTATLPAGGESPVRAPRVAYQQPIPPYGNGTEVAGTGGEASVLGNQFQAGTGGLAATGIQNALPWAVGGLSFLAVGIMALVLGRRRRVSQAS